MYDEKAKARMMKYMHIKRESLQLNLPLGTKDLWKDYAADMGISVTELITRLIIEYMKKHNWTQTLNPYNMASKPKNRWLTKMGLQAPFLSIIFFFRLWSHVIRIECFCPVVFLHILFNQLGNQLGHTHPQYMSNVVRIPFLFKYLSTKYANELNIDCREIGFVKNL